MYDITNSGSTENLDGWLNFVSDNALPETVSILIGNKNDLEEHRQVPKVTGKVNDTAYARFLASDGSYLKTCI